MAIDTAKLAKMLALVDSPAPGEAAAATALITAMLESAGKSWRDLTAILATAAATPRQASAAAWAPGGASPFRSFDDFMEEQEPGHKARCAAEWHQKAQEKAAFRAALIARYGSEKAALAPTPMERAVDEAVAPFLRKEMHDGRFSWKTLDGWATWGDPVSEPVAAAVRAALPLPTTIAEAGAEYESWRERNRELAAIHGEEADTWLSLGCSLREMIVHRLLSRELRANGIGDALVRWRSIMDSGMPPSTEEREVVLADLECLAKKHGGVVQSGQPETVTARRTRILNLLSNMDTAALSDREIARRVGVSPQTVGNLRRKLRH